MDEQQARLNFVGPLLAIDRHRDQTFHETSRGTAIHWMNENGTKRRRKSKGQRSSGSQASVVGECRDLECGCLLPLSRRMLAQATLPAAYIPRSEHWDTG